MYVADYIFVYFLDFFETLKYRLKKIKKGLQPGLQTDFPPPPRLNLHLPRSQAEEGHGSVSEARRRWEIEREGTTCGRADSLRCAVPRAAAGSEGSRLLVNLGDADAVAGTGELHGAASRVTLEQTGAPRSSRVRSRLLSLLF
jgi:hypothetical protein